MKTESRKSASRFAGQAVARLAALPVSRRRAAAIVEGIEHHLSDAALAKLKLLVVAWRRSSMNGR